MPEIENQYYQVKNSFVDLCIALFVLTNFQSNDQQFSLAGEKLKPVGKLIMRIGNVGSVGASPPSLENLKSNAVRLIDDLFTRRNPLFSQRCLAFAPNEPNHRIGTALRRRSIARCWNDSSGHERSSSDHGPSYRRGVSESQFRPSQSRKWFQREEFSPISSR